MLRAWSKSHCTCCKEISSLVVLGTVLLTVRFLISSRSSATAKSTARPFCLVGVLYDIYREKNNRSTANQPLVRNCMAMKPTQFREITQNNGHYNVQGRSRSPILVPIESPYTTLVIISDCTISKLRLIICKILTRDSRALHFLTPSLGVIPSNIAVSDIPLKLDSTGYISLAECIGVSSTTFA